MNFSIRRDLSNQPACGALKMMWMIEFSFVFQRLTIDHFAEMNILFRGFSFANVSYWHDEQICSMELCSFAFSFVRQSRQSALK